MEVYRYKVVYPGGTFVRISPNMDAEKTGQVLDFGSIFESSKSIFLDGINYVQLSEGGGWVFGSKGSTEVLNLVELIRAPTSSTSAQNPGVNKTTCNSLLSSCAGADSVEASSEDVLEFSSGLTDCALVSPERDSSANCTGTEIGSHTTPESLRSEQFISFTNSQTASAPSSGSIDPKQYHRNTTRQEQLYWRGIRARCRECTTFEDFSALCVMVNYAHQLSSRPPSVPEPGPARSAWMAHTAISASPFSSSPHAQSGQRTKTLRATISIVAAVTRQCVDAVADVGGLEAHLWVLVNAGASAVAHVMQLCVNAANERFEGASKARQAEMIEKVLEVGAITKQHHLDLARKADMLGDDMRNFLQRWTIIRWVPENAPEWPQPLKHKPRKSRKERKERRHRNRSRRRQTNDVDTELAREVSTCRVSTEKNVYMNGQHQSSNAGNNIEETASMSSSSRSCNTSVTSAESSVSAISSESPAMDGSTSNCFASISEEDTNGSDSEYSSSDEERDASYDDDSYSDASNNDYYDDDNDNDEDLQYELCETDDRCGTHHYRYESRDVAICKDNADTNGVNYTAEDVFRSRQVTTKPGGRYTTLNTTTGVVGNWSDRASDNAKAGSLHHSRSRYSTCPQAVAPSESPVASSALPAPASKSRSPTWLDSLCNPQAVLARASVLKGGSNSGRNIISGSCYSSEGMLLNKKRVMIADEFQSVRTRTAGSGGCRESDVFRRNGGGIAFLSGFLSDCGNNLVHLSQDPEYQLASML